MSSSRKRCLIGGGPLAETGKQDCISEQTNSANHVHALLSATLFMQDSSTTTHICIAEHGRPKRKEHSQTRLKQEQQLTAE